MLNRNFGSNIERAQEEFPARYCFFFRLKGANLEPVIIAEEIDPFPAVCIGLGSDNGVRSEALPHPTKHHEISCASAAFWPLRFFFFFEIGGVLLPELRSFSRMYSVDPSTNFMLS